MAAEKLGVMQIKAKEWYDRNVIKTKSQVYKNGDVVFVLTIV